MGTRPPVGNRRYSAGQMPEQNIVVPSVAESVSEVTILSWHKQIGDFADADEPICEVETDKANVDLPNEVGPGVITAHLVKAGETVAVGEPVAKIDTDKTQADAGSGESASKTEEKQETPRTETTEAGTDPTPATGDGDVATEKLLDLSPAVRRLVSERRIDPDRIPATGPRGRLTKQDVLAFVDEQVTPKAEAPAQPKVTEQPKPQPPPPSRGVASVGSTGQPTRRVAMSKIRRRIAENLVAAQQNAAILTTFNEIDLTEVMALRKKYKDPFGEKHGVGLGFMSFFAKAACVALSEFERVNARIDGEEIVYHDYVNLGVAVSTDRGLTVPVVKDVQDMSFAAIEKEIKRVALAARDGKLGLAEMSGGTFTITNGGVFGSLLSTPILNAPQSGILGMHTIQQRPMAVDGEVRIRPMMYVALSYDHRLVDGKESVSFLVRLKELLEDPARLLLDV